MFTLIRPDKLKSTGRYKSQTGLRVRGRITRINSDWPGSASKYSEVLGLTSKFSEDIQNMTYLKPHPILVRPAFHATTTWKDARSRDPPFCYTCSAMLPSVFNTVSQLPDATHGPLRHAVASVAQTFPFRRDQLFSFFSPSFFFFYHFFFFCIHVYIWFFIKKPHIFEKKKKTTARPMEIDF